MADNACALNTWVNAHQPLFERLDDLTRKYGADQVNKLICLTPPLQAFSNEGGLRVTISTAFFLENTRNVKSLFTDATHKITLNGIFLIIYGIVTLHGRFIPAFVEFATTEDDESYGKPLREVNDYLQKVYAQPLSPAELVHDNDDSIFKVTKANLGPQHWVGLAAQEGLVHVNCFVHLLANFSDSKGRRKFDSASRRASHTLTVNDLKAELRKRHVPVAQGLKKADLVLLFEQVIEREQHDLGEPELVAESAVPASNINCGTAPSTGGKDTTKKPRSQFDLYNKQFLADIRTIAWEIQRPEQLEAVFRLFKKKWHMLPNVIQNLEAEYWGPLKGRWQRCRTATNNNNPLERYNRTLKEKWLHGRALSYCEALDSFKIFFELSSLEEYHLTDANPTQAYHMAPAVFPVIRTRVTNLWTRACLEYRAILRWSTPDPEDASVFYIRNASYKKLFISNENWSSDRSRVGRSSMLDSMTSSTSQALTRRASDSSNMA